MIALLVLLAALIAVLEWTNRRCLVLPMTPTGWTGGPDRDHDRLVDDLRTIADGSCANW